MNKLLFKRYPYLNRLIKKIASNNTPDNTNQFIKKNKDTPDILILKPRGITEIKVI